MNRQTMRPTGNNNEKWPHSYEQPISYAPLVQLTNNNWVVPQHFLRYKHTLASVSEVLGKINFSTHFTVLAAQKDNQIYLQVAVLSPDNYQTNTQSPNAKKLLFGRRWYVEDNLPTSELIQTAFLALKIAREHEVRELFQFNHEHGTSTPFNNHHDLPLMADNPALVHQGDDEGSDINMVLTRCLFAGEHLKLVSVQNLDSACYLYRLQLMCSACQLSEFNNAIITFVVADNTSNGFLHGLMNALVCKSHEYVSEQFSYAGLARFSKCIAVEKVGELSIKLRSHNVLQLCSLGKQQANILNFEIDSARAPQGCDSEITGFLAAHGIERPENAHLYSKQFKAD
ncbi:hypothetical protein NQT69_06410 [Pseudoalteromonas shioyasakiensis]|uniref:hypothetical protein n=1 Tax=Pseudoalteromonas shioyasakiensis TaxID=1190813 RepID=UPI0021173A79|nr:hypothetical protein [Pseudoalteromonas shioyasakiensis]MCQ8877652.1 hypothetical protein [Pseudoalteromonas shioyasakiensis]